MKEVLLKFYSTAHYELDKRMCADWKDFSRAWEIVDEKGSKEIIKLFIS